MAAEAEEAMARASTAEAEAEWGTVSGWVGEVGEERVEMAQAEREVVVEGAMGQAKRTAVTQEAEE